MKKYCSVLGLLVCFCVLWVIVSTTGCSQADIVNQNISKEADNFNINRRLVVFNDMTGDIKMTVEGKMSITADTADNQLEIIAEIAPGLYKKDFIGLNIHTSYIVEQIEVAEIDRYKYVVNFNPNMWVPVSAEVID